MKKLLIPLLSLICIFALSVPVFADLVWIPPETTASETAALETAVPEALSADRSSILPAVLLVGCGIVAAAFVLFFMLRKKKN